MDSDLKGMRHQAIRKCKEYVEAGYKWTVDIDLAKYFDTVNHDKLMRILSETIKDGRVLSLIQEILTIRSNDKWCGKGNGGRNTAGWEFITAS